MHAFSVCYITHHTTPPPNQPPNQPTTQSIKPPQMAQQCLVLFALFADMDERSDKADQTNAAAAAFLFLLSCLYGLFGGLLFLFRNKLLAGALRFPVYVCDCDEGQVQVVLFTFRSLD